MLLALSHTTLVLPSDVLGKHQVLFRRQQTLLRPVTQLRRSLHPSTLERSGYEPV